MKSLDQLRKEVLADGIIDAAEVLEIKTQIYSDGKIDQEEADFLFDLNDKVSGNQNHSSWKELFIQAISDFVLEDDGSPGELDDQEIKYLKNKIEGDGQIDRVELALLDHLEKTLGSLPKALSNLKK